MRILVGFNGSDASRRALVHAAELVGRGGILDVINVIGSQPVSARVGSLVDGERKHQQRVLHEARDLLGEWEVRMTPHTGLGDPTSEIRAAAEESGAGVIVVGRGKGVRRLVDGSVSARLVRRAPCDVLVVH
jgi:nucleotide-binding universal stress UspA family protein